MYNTTNRQTDETNSLTPLSLVQHEVITITADISTIMLCVTMAQHTTMQCDTWSAKCRSQNTALFMAIKLCLDLSSGLCGVGCTDEWKIMLYTKVEMHCTIKIQQPETNLRIISDTAIENYYISSFPSGLN